ncbi:MAG: hypothetical protein IT561_16020, partial [Alphaproteobacteria bacterium]|nr:hypothetical protein [Alphaproteobacteria bacterium]
MAALDRWPFRFTPQRWPSLIALPAIVVLIGLGVWQLQRHEWKAGLIAEREAAMAAAPTPLPARID